MQSVSNLLKEHNDWKKKAIDFLKQLDGVDLNIVVLKYKILRISDGIIRVHDIANSTNDSWKLDTINSNILVMILQEIDNMFNVVKQIK